MSWKDWPGKEAFLSALRAGKRADFGWCTNGTLAWLAKRVQVDVAVPGSRLGDIPSGMLLIGSLYGVPIGLAKVAPQVFVIVKGRESFHVRLEEGDVHAGLPGTCDVDVCLVEGVMLE